MFHPEDDCLIFRNSRVTKTIRRQNEPVRPLRLPLQRIAILRHFLNILEHRQARKIYFTLSFDGATVLR